MQHHSVNILWRITNSLNCRNNFPYQQWELRTSRYHFIIIACIVYTSRTNIHSSQVCQWSNNWIAFRRLTGCLSLVCADSLWRRTVIDGFRCHFMWESSYHTTKCLCETGALKLRGTLLAETFDDRCNQISKI